MFEEHEWRTIHLATLIAGSFSLLAIFAAIILFLCGKRNRNDAAELVFYMAITELICVPAFMFGRRGIEAGESSALCQVQAVAIQLGNLAAIYWAGCIALDLYLIVLRRHIIDQIIQLHKRVYIPVCLFVLFGLSVAPLFVRDKQGDPFYGDGDSWCWVSRRFVNWRLYIFYVPLWAIFLFNVTVYLAVGRVLLQQAQRMRLKKYTRIYAKNVSLYLISFIIVWIPPTIYRVYGILNPDSPHFTLCILHAVFMTGGAMLTCCVYIYGSLVSRTDGNTDSHLGPCQTCEPPITLDLRESSLQYTTSEFESGICMTDRSLERKMGWP